MKDLRITYFKRLTQDEYDNLKPIQHNTMYFIEDVGCFMLKGVRYMTMATGGDAIAGDSNTLVISPSALKAVAGLIGNLITNKKDNLVNAINEVFIPFKTTQGSANNYSITGVDLNVSKLLRVQFHAANTSTSCTLSVNGTSYPIYKSGTTNPTNGLIVANAQYLLAFTGSSFLILGTQPIATVSYPGLVTTTNVVANNSNVPTSAAVFGVTGDTTTLLTLAKNNLVAAINELQAKANNSGQIKVNYTGLSRTNFSNGTVYTLPLNTATAAVVAPPTTKYPKGSPTNYTAMYDSSSQKLRENNIEGQVHRWRVQATYTNKASGNNGQMEFRLRNLDSGFVVTAENTMPSGLTTGNITCELTTIANSDSLNAGRGYVLEVVSSFADTNMVVNVNSITRVSEATENV